MRIEEFELLGKSFAVSLLPAMIRKEALERLQAHKKKGHRIVIISASLETWIKPWADAYGVDLLLAGRPEVSEGRLTGRLAGENCFGEEKVKRLLGTLPRERAWYEIYAYGDSRGDADILADGDNAFFRAFHDK